MILIFLTPQVLLAALDDIEIIYVNRNVPNGDGSGSSCNNTTNELSDALKAAKELNDVTPALYVKFWSLQPIFLMYNAADKTVGDCVRDNASVMLEDVKIFDEFSENADYTKNSPETLDSIISARNTKDWNANPTILSGDLNSNDGPGLTNITENTRHVVICEGDVVTACLDGFTITGGNAYGTSSIKVNTKTIAVRNGGGIS